MVKSVRFAGAAAVILTLFACNSETISGDLGGLALEATAIVSTPPAQNVQVTAKITNISTGSLDVVYGGCSVTPVFHTGSLDGPIAYDPRPTQTCTTNTITKTLQPDEAFTITGSAVANVPAGKYYVEAVIGVNGQETSVGAGTVTF